MTSLLTSQEMQDLVSQLVAARRRASDHDHNGDLTRRRSATGVGLAVGHPVPQGGDRS